MGALNSDLSLLLALSVSATAVLLAIGVTFLCRHTLRASFRDLGARLSGKSRSRAFAETEQLKTDLSEFREKISQLEEYAPEYHNSFSSGGWAWLITTSEHLSVAESILDAFLSSGRYHDAYTLAAFLNGTLAHAEMPLAALRFADFVDLLEWKSRSKEQLLKLLEVVQQGADLNKEIGLQRARKRKPTIMTLSEIKRELER